MLVLSVEGSVVSILQLGDMVGVFNGSFLYLLVETADKCLVSTSGCGGGDAISKGSLALKMHIRMHQKVLAMCSLFMGFVLVKKKKEKLYVDVYKTGPRMVQVEKKVSAQLPESACNDVSCSLTSVRCGDLDPILASLLLEEKALVWSQVIFIGLGCGQVYCVPVATESRSPVGIPKMLYCTTQPIAGIVCLRDPVTCLYSHVGVVLRSGPVVYIMSDQQKLKYHMVYLPGSVEECLPVKDGIVATDVVDLWHSKLTKGSGGQPVVENRVTGIKGVCAMDLVPDSDFILVVTLHLTLYCVQLGTKMPACQPENFIVPPSVMADMDRKMQHLTKLKQQMAVEEKMLEAISISKRDKLLQNTFTLSVQVYDASRGTDAAQYAFEINLKNNEDQDFCPETWSLHVSINSEGMNVNQTIKLEQRIRKGVSLKTLITASIPEPFSLIQVSCSLVAKISEDGDTEGTYWAVIPVAVATLDVSFFFLPFCQSCKSSLSEDLLKIGHSHMGEKIKRLESQENTEPVQHVYEFRLITEWATPSDIWAAVTKNCRHLFTKVMTGRELQLYIGCHCIKLLLNAEFSTMHIRCKDIKLLHHLKQSLAQLLNEENNFKKTVLINCTIFSMAQNLKADVELEGKNLNLLKGEWRHAVAKYLPL
ncbi:uncharacterized protein LOC110835652 isoform X3 [Zootermopsis nevadensis]|uniref:uncharacterized protein LOC110835652 isoform X3 n=1 Tax=Zootermopsis nevadensis TaxID=136037 RepID=UPI000B8ED71D|nr:uncharacterized protein LOC110835652 isoform X3 [Zootermopsis nevadensis]